MEIIGHRGAKGLAKENTLTAIEKAIALKVDMIEVDVRLHENKYVLSHDPTLITGSYDSLDEMLKIVAGKVPLNLEIKEFEVIENLASATKNYSGRIIYSSFKYAILAEIKKQIPGAELAVLEKWSGIRAVAEAELLGTKRLHIRQSWLWGGFVRSLKSRDYEVYAYTVNTIERADELASWGVDGIITDYPDRFLK